jgi:hypothetical protein
MAPVTVEISLLKHSKHSCRGHKTCGNRVARGSILKLHATDNASVIWFTAYLYDEGRERCEVGVVRSDSITMPLEYYQDKFVVVMHKSKKGAGFCKAVIVAEDEHKFNPRNKRARQEQMIFPLHRDRDGPPQLVGVDFAARKTSNDALLTPT